MPIPLTGPFAANAHADAIRSPQPAPSRKGTGPKAGDDNFHNVFGGPPAENAAKTSEPRQTATRPADIEDTERPGGLDQADGRGGEGDFETADTDDIVRDRPLQTKADDKSGPYLKGAGDQTGTVQGLSEQIDKDGLATGEENTFAGSAPEFVRTHADAMRQPVKSVSIIGNFYDPADLLNPAGSGAWADAQGRISHGNPYQTQTQIPDLSVLVDDEGAKLPQAVDLASVPVTQSSGQANQGQSQTMSPLAGSDRILQVPANGSLTAVQVTNQPETEAKTAEDTQDQLVSDPARQASDRYSVSAVEHVRAASASRVSMAIIPPPALAGLAPFAGNTPEADRHIPNTDTGVISDTRSFSDLGSTAKSAADPVFQSQIPRHLALQVAGAVHRAGADQPISLLLNPAELGRVKISMTTTDAGVSVTVVADRPETLDLMRRHIDVLAQEFRDIGYGSSQFSFGQSTSEHRSETQHGGQGQTLSVDPATDSITPVTTPSITLDRVDIRL
ncbi:Flagellar hook-length control protein FliK [Roseovarius litorisediminis]|uniref:Flagellar hook-length control protein FliK n=1 Tax=Roseovarius litorisediminis TaxID=1312363 RepID=A0A1Y5SNS2_9RHOB|nr:Flagellar hook-length control protein FliK [Roseovarius litorisediminis]